MLNMLNELQVRNAKPKVRLAKGSRGTDANLQGDEPRARLTKLADGGGLLLWIEPNGAKRWRMAYRFGGKQKSLAFGSYPAVSLAEARAARAAAQELLRAGIDPSQHKRAQKAAQVLAQLHTFKAVAADMVAKRTRDGRAARTIEKMKWLLSLALPALGAKPITDIKASEVLAVLQAVDRRGNHESARKLRATIGQVFRYAMAINPDDEQLKDHTAKLRGPNVLTELTVTPMAAITEPGAFGGLLRAIDGLEGGAPETRLALLLLSLTFVRPGELRGARWEEFDLDAELPTWIIPAARMKSRKREHKVPLSRQAVEIVRELRALARGPFLFPSERSPTTRCMSENTINSALRRMGYSKEQMCGHGFRSAASSLLNESKLWHADAIEWQLAHLDKDRVRRAYNRAEFWDERVEMMQWWSDRCDEMRANVGVARAA
ncbi:MAG: integrase arm-type DNA-binding domain-containing protein [Methylocystis sp.]